MSKRYLILVLLLTISACRYFGPQIVDIETRPFSPTSSIEPGAHHLGLGGFKFINGSIQWRDGLLYVPRRADKDTPLPLLIWLHGGGGDAESYRFMFPIAEELGVVIAALDARHNTWDGIDSPFGPDVMFIDATLKHIFERVSIDPQRIALGGLSDGASYALALGRVNGDLFTHLVATAPGYLKPPAPTQGSPAILVAHGRQDNVFDVSWSRKVVVPDLRGAGYDVTFLEFDGPHWVPEPVARKIMQWLKR
jgi:phospholipase/carboxylesterase